MYDDKSLPIIDMAYELVLQINRVAPPRLPRSCNILKMDVSSFYPSVRPDILLDLLEWRILDTDLVQLLSGFLGNRSGTLGVGISLGAFVFALPSNLCLFRRRLLGSFKLQSMAVN